MDDWVDVEVSMKNSFPDRSLLAQSSVLAKLYYEAVEKGALSRLQALHKSPIFHVDLGQEPAYTTFLDNLAPDLIQENRCTACRRFVNRYGDLALVNDDGTLEPLFWSLADLDRSKLIDVYGSSVNALRKRFESARVTQEFKVFDTRKNIGDMTYPSKFRHFRQHFPASRVCKAQSIGFTSADTVELMLMLKRVLDDYSLDTLREVGSILRGDKLPYAGRHWASAKWLLELVEKNKIGRAKGDVERHNLVSRYAAASFVGQLKQIRSGALSTLLKNVAEKQPWSVILSEWQKICDPLRYMRPQAAPSQGNIDAAERLFSQLGLTKEDLKRRLLVQDDVPAEVIMWSSEKMEARKRAKISTNIFGAVKPKTIPARSSVRLSTPSIKMTFTRFLTKVLPTTKRVDCWLKPNDHITTCITGLPGSKPLMQWHDDEGKNLASHYVWRPAPNVRKHSLKPEDWNEVRCLIPYPSLWDGVPLTTTFPLLDPDSKDGNKFKHYHKSKGFRYLFVLEDNHETKLTSLPLFPEIMKSEFHGVRSTIEAFSKTERIQDVDDGMMKGGFVAGVSAHRSSDDQKLKMRVHLPNGETEIYEITLFE